MLCAMKTLSQRHAATMQSAAIAITVKDLVALTCFPCRGATVHASGDPHMPRGRRILRLRLFESVVVLVVVVGLIVLVVGRRGRRGRRRFKPRPQIEPGSNHEIEDEEEMVELKCALGHNQQHRQHRYEIHQMDEARGQATWTNSADQCVCVCVCVCASPTGRSRRTPACRAGDPRLLTASPNPQIYHKWQQR